MANLIITLISIALIAVIAVATLYNGGDAFRQGSASGAAAQMVNAGQQITAANILFANDNGGELETSLATLASTQQYLSSIPRVPQDSVISDDITDNDITISGVNQQVCEAVNKQAGEGNDVVLTTEADVDGFGCYDNAGDYTFVFR